MKKVYQFMLVAAATLFIFASCSDDDYYWDDRDDYYFDVEQALDDYFYKYGAFGTDDQTTANWFSSNYPDAYQSDWNDFVNGIAQERDANKRAMARILTTGAWNGPMQMNWRDQGNSQYQQASCTAEYDFDLAKSNAAYGRGKETRTDYSDGSADTQTAFNWEIDDYGNIILDFDSDEGQGKGVEMVVYYADLNLDDDQDLFAGTMTSNTEGLDEYDDFEFHRASYAKAAPGAQKQSSGLSFSGKGTPKNALTAVKRSVKTNSHR